MGSVALTVIPMISLNATVLIRLIKQELPFGTDSDTVPIIPLSPGKAFTKDTLLFGDNLINCPLTDVLPVALRNLICAIKDHFHKDNDKIKKPYF